MDDVTIRSSEQRHSLRELHKWIRWLRATAWLGVITGAAFLLWAGPGVLPAAGRHEWPTVGLLVGPLAGLGLVRLVTSLSLTEVRPWRRAVLLLTPGVLAAAPFFALAAAAPDERQWLTAFGLAFTGLYGSDAFQLNNAFSTYDRLTRPPATSPWPREIGSTRLFLHVPEVRTGTELAGDWHQQQWLVRHHAVTTSMRHELAGASLFGCFACLMIFAGTVLFAEPIWSILVLAPVFLLLGVALLVTAYVRHREEAANSDRYGLPVHPDDADTALRSAKAVHELLLLGYDQLPRWARHRVAEAVSHQTEAVHTVRQAWLSRKLTEWRESVSALAEVEEYARRALDDLER